MERINFYVFLIVVFKLINNIKCKSASNLIRDNNNNDDKIKLLGVIEIINHGASTPVKYFDVMKNVFAPDPSGILTGRGAKQIKILGDYFRNKYFSARNSPYTLDRNGNYLALSLGLPRCINSAITHLQAIFPKDLVAFRNYQTINNDNPLIINKSNLGNYFDFKEFINRTEENNIKDTFINFMNNSEDKLLSPRKCFRFNRQALQEADEVDNISEEQKDILVQKLNSTFPKLIDDLINSNFDSDVMTNIFDLLISVNYHYPESVKYDANLVNILAKHKIKHHYEYLNDEEDIKLLSSNLFDLFVNTFDKQVNYEKGNLRKIINGKRNNYNSLFIFGDERNFIDILNNLIDKEYIRSLIQDRSDNLEIYQELLPPYASHLIFELLKVEDNFYVKIIYNGEEIFIDQKKIKRLMDNNIIYDSKYGMKFEDFKSLLLSRINDKYRSMECKK